jgi:hypothetical protein
LTGINITIANLGWNNESVQIDLYANSTLLATGSIEIMGGSNTNTAMNFSTSILSPGNYTLRILANPVQGETYTTDNTLSTKLSIPEQTLPILCLILLPPIFWKIKTRP